TSLHTAGAVRQGHLPAIKGGGSPNHNRARVDSHQPAGGAGTPVLVIDDNPDSRESLRILLSLYDYDTLGATSSTPVPNTPPAPGVISSLAGVIPGGRGRPRGP